MRLRQFLSVLPGTLMLVLGLFVLSFSFGIPQTFQNGVPICNTSTGPALCVAITQGASGGAAGAPLSQATSSPVGGFQGIGVQGVFGGLNVPIAADAAGRLSINCALNCQPPFQGGASGVVTGSGQSVGIASYNAVTNTMEAVRSYNGAVDVSDTPGGFPSTANYSTANSASCTNISNSPLAWGVGLVNASTGGVAQTVSIALYNTSSATCTAGTEIYTTVLGAGQAFTLPIPKSAFNIGLSYKDSGAANNNIYLIWF